jgi:hypothetical protein
MSKKIYADFQATIKGPKLGKLVSQCTDEHGDQFFEFLSSCGSKSDVEDLTTTNITMLSEDEGKFEGSIIVRTDDDDCLKKIKLKLNFEDEFYKQYKVKISGLWVTDSK